MVITVPTLIHAGDFYVDAVNGSDDTGDGSEINPWKKLQFAVDSIEGTVENPHTIHLAPGFYGPEGSGDEKYMHTDSYESIQGVSPFSVKVFILQVRNSSNIVVSGIQGRLAIMGSGNVVTDHCIIINNSTGG